MITTDFLFSLARQVMQIAGTYLVAKGVGDQAAVDAMLGGILSAASIFWSYWHHTPDTPAKG